MLTASTLLFILFVVILFDHFQRLRKYKWLYQFDGPAPTLPIVGNALQFIGHRSRMAGVLTSNFQNFGSTFKLWLMESPTLVTSDPQLVKVILNSSKHLQKHFGYSYSAKLLLGNGLVTSDVEQWKSDRKYLNPFFNLECFGSSFKLCVDNWPTLENTLDTSKSNPMSCRKHFNIFILEVIMKLFSSNPNFTKETLLSDLEDQFSIGFEILNVRIMKPWTRIPLYWKLSGYQLILQNFHKQIQTLFSAVLADCSYLREENLRVSTKQETDTRSPKTFKDLIMDTTKSWEWRYDHSVTIIGAGVDTTGIAATMTLFFLALNPECQEKAHHEIDSLFSEDKLQVLNFHDISKMKYLRMCIKEAMRLHPPIPLLGRTTTEDIIMQDGRKIPTGASIMIPLQDLSLNPEYFPDPHRFDPERFSETNAKSIEPYTYMPFSAGPRNCIGQKFSESVLTPLLAQVLRKYTVTTQQKAKDIKILHEVAGTPFPEVELIFKRRT